MKNLTFLTVNSGHAQPSSRAEVKQFTTNMLYPLVMANGGAIPNLPGWTFRLTPVAGGAFFSVSNGADIVTAGAVVGTQAAADELWPHLEQMHLANYQGMIQMLGGAKHLPNNWIANPVRPKELPWLAVVLQPGLVKHPFAGIWLADFEKCLAWTVLDLENPQN